MTAPQTYSVQDEKDRAENLASEEEHSPCLHEQITNVLLKLNIQAGAIDTIGELMINAAMKQDTACVGLILIHYTDLLLDGLGHIEEILNSDIREGAE